MNVDNMLNNESLSIIWDKCLGYIKGEIGAVSYETWFQTTKLVGYDNKTATIEVPNKFFADFIEEHYGSVIMDSFEEIGVNRPVLDFLANSSSDWDIADEIVESRSVIKPLIKENKSLKQFNSNYTFNSFIVGDSNQFAHAAALAVSEAPGKTTFNPLVIYGKTGLGKTHLLQAIGNFALKEETARKVVYVTSEEFTNQFIKYVHRIKKSSEFYNLYKDVDILLLDDVQFFSGKAGTQEVFSRILNSLYQLKCQVVVTSDRPPQEIPDMAERLLNRFSGGLVTDIHPPNVETRMAIIKQKAECDGVKLPDDVVEYVANNIKNNVRELEGALVKLIAYSSITGIGINLNVTKELLNDSIDKTSRRVTIEQIQNLTAESMGVSPSVLRTHTRKKEVSIARQITMYLAKQHTVHSLKNIGLALGGRDYSTVIHACKKVERMLKEDSIFANKVKQIENKLVA